MVRVALVNRFHEPEVLNKANYLIYLRSDDNQIEIGALSMHRVRVYEGIGVRWIAIALVAALVSGAGSAAEPEVTAVPAAEVVTTVIDYAQTARAASDIAKVAVPSSVPQITPQKVAKLEKKGTIKKSMLSRSARSQMSLLSTKAMPELAASFKFIDDGDDDEGADDLDLHRSFSRPKLAGADDQDDEQIAHPAVSETVKLRLFLARMKAVEAHKMASAAADEHASADVSDAVKLRLLIARTKAVQAHERKFS